MPLAPEGDHLAISPDENRRTCILMQVRLLICLNYKSRWDQYPPPYPPPELPLLPELPLEPLEPELPLLPDEPLEPELLLLEELLEPELLLLEELVLVVVVVTAIVGVEDDAVPTEFADAVVGP